MKVKFPLTAMTGNIAGYYSFKYLLHHSVSKKNGGIWNFNIADTVYTVPTGGKPIFKYCGNIKK